MGDDYAGAAPSEAAPKPDQPQEPAQPSGAEPAASAAVAQDERFVAATPVAATPSATAATSGASLAARSTDAALVGETDEQGIAGAAPERAAAAAPATPAAPVAGATAPAALGAASAAAAAEAARRPPPVVAKHVPRAPLPAPALGAGPVQSFKEALPRVGASVMGACAVAFLAVALALAWRWTAGYGLFAALPGALLGLAAVLLAASGYLVTQHVLPLTAPLTRPPAESIPALARRIVRPALQRSSL